MDGGNDGEIKIQKFSGNTVQTQIFTSFHFNFNHPDRKERGVNFVLTWLQTVNITVIGTCFVNNFSNNQYFYDFLYIRLGKDTAVAQSIDDYKRGKCENDFMTSLDSSVNPAVKDAEVPFAKEESGYGSGFENTNTPRTSVSTSPGVSESSQKNFGSEDSGNSEVDSGHSESSINPRSRTQSQECLHVLENKTNRCEIAGIEDNVECQPEYTLIDLWRIYGVDSQSF